MATPQIFDLTALRHHMIRAQKQGYATFLLERVTEDLIDRMSPILRSFTHAIDIGTPTSLPLNSLIQSNFIQKGIRLTPVSKDETDFLACEESPFAPPSSSYDFAFSLLALQAVNDLPGALVQIRRLLKPDGLFIGCLLGGETLSELRQSFLQAEMEIEGGASPRVIPFGEIRNLGDLMHRAGFALPVIDSERLTIRYPNAFTLMADLRAMGMTNPLLNRKKTLIKKSTLVRMAEIYQTQFSDPDNKVRATFDLIWLLGWAPDDSQPKPLRPGQFTIPLKEAIKNAQTESKDKNFHQNICKNK